MASASDAEILCTFGRMNWRHANRVFVITGGTQGLGLAICSFVGRALRIKCSFSLEDKGSGRVYRTWFSYCAPGYLVGVRSGRRVYSYTSVVAVPILFRASWTLLPLTRGNLLTTGRALIYKWRQCARAFSRHSGAIETLIEPRPIRHCQYLQRRAAHGGTPISS
jgi:hypothetical protein